MSRFGRRQRQIPMVRLVLGTLVCILTSAAGPMAAQTPQKQSPQRQIPRNMFPVQPITAASTPPAATLSLNHGQFFSYALPQGWHVAEEGQFAVSLVAADTQALTVMVGNAGMPVNYPPARFVYEKLSALRPINLQIGQPRPATPIAGFSSAFQFDVSYSARGAANRGTATCHIAPVYDSAVMVLTLAAAEASQWPGYASWLPMVAEQISATNGAAFGRRGVMAQNLQNSVAYGEAARRYRDWSQKNWQGVTDARNISEDAKNFYRRENLGGVQTYANPFGGNTQVQLPPTYSHYWTDRQGNVLGTNDPSVNPNAGSTTEWKSMPRYKP